MSRPDCLVDCVMCALVAELQRELLEACDAQDFIRSLSASVMLRRIDGEVRR